MDLTNFDSDQVEAPSFDLIPNGWYEAIICESEQKLTKAQDRGLNLKFTLIQDPYKGRMQFDFLNINHSTSEQAKNIARSHLKAICVAVNVPKPKDSTELHNIPLLIKIGQEPRQDTGEITNVVKGYKARNAASPVQAAPIQKAQPVPATAGSAPWKK